MVFGLILLAVVARPLTVLFFDADDLKLVNDNLGNNRSLAELLDQADAAMYEKKRQRRLARGAGGAAQQVAAADAALRLG
jgi:GGDEF domain-containing protein